MKKNIILCLFAIFFSSIALQASVPPKVLEAQGSIVRVLNVDIPALGYGASYSSGTGYIIDSQKGYILTNHHVVDDNLSLLVYFNQWERPDTLPAYVIFSDEDRDLAVIRVKEDISDRKALRFADTLSLSMGDDVFVLGYPSTGLDNFELKYAKGVIGSHVSDSIIQLSATVNPGNSGGPALNANGEVIGTIYSKLQDRFENVGNILSNRLNYWTLDSADTYMTEEFYSDYFKERDSLGNVIGIRDTVDMLAYEYISMAHKFHAASERVDPDTTSRMEYLEQAIEAAEKAVEEDPENMVMRFHHLNMLFDAATLSCMGSSDKEEKGSRKFAKRVNKALEDIDKTIDELPRNERKEWREVQYLAEWRFEKVVDDDEVDCELWSRIVENIEARRKMSRIRHREFDRYLDYGYYPYFLSQALRGQGYTDPFSLDGSSSGSKSNAKFFGTAFIGFRSYGLRDERGTVDQEISASGAHIGVRFEAYPNNFTGYSVELNYAPTFFTYEVNETEVEISDRGEHPPVEFEVGARFFVLDASVNLAGLLIAEQPGHQVFFTPSLSYGLSWPRVFFGEEQDFTFGFGIQSWAISSFIGTFDEGPSGYNSYNEFDTYYFNGSYFVEDLESYVGLEMNFGEGMNEVRACYTIQF